MNSFMQMGILGILLIALLMHSVQISALQRELKDLKASLSKMDPASAREPALNI